MSTLPVEDAVPSKEKRDALRARLVAETPGWYNPWLHLAVPSTFGIAIITAALLSLRDLNGWELLAVPLTYLVSNATEWRAHRDLLHKRFPLAPILYDQHTPKHHMLYVTADMEIRDRKEWRLVLIPAYGIFMIFAGVMPLTLAVGWAGQRNVAALFLATAMAYVVGYEWLHLSYHLPATSRVGRNPLTRLLKRHHALHHDPRLMQRWNFNVTVPIWDFLRDTIWSPEKARREEELHAAREPMTP